MNRSSLAKINQQYLIKTAIQAGKKNKNHYLIRSLIEKEMKLLEKFYPLFSNNFIIQSRFLTDYIYLSNESKAISLFDKLEPSLQTKFENSMSIIEHNVQSDIKFYNFWVMKYPKENWFYRFIKHRKLNNKEIGIFSILGLRDNIQNTKNLAKIFYTGENIFWEYNPGWQAYHNYCLEDFDLSLGLEYLKHPKYLRFLLWIMHNDFIAPNISYDELKTQIEFFNNPSNRLTPIRHKFASMIARHDPTPHIRTKLVELLQTIANIECVGQLLHNTDDLHLEFKNNKNTYLKQFKFNICPENSMRYGYVTEKLLESIKAGGIPIYWGAQPIEEGILNQEAILFFDTNNSQKLYKQVDELWRNEQLYQEFSHIPPFTKDAGDIIWQKLESLELHIKRIAL